MVHRIGVIGVGIIGEPVVRGLVHAHGDAVEVHLSPRNAERAARLAAEFSQVRMEATNQAVVDNCDWIVVALLGAAAETVLRALTFRPTQHMVSLIGAASLASLRKWTGLSTITRMIPLPYVAQGFGPVATYPITPEVEELFGDLGTLVAATTEPDLDTMATITSTQSAFFAVLSEVVQWGTRRGLAPDTSQEFTIQFYSALLTRAARLDSSEMAEVWREMTPGGTNYTAITKLNQVNAITAWSAAMDSVHARLTEPIQVQPHSAPQASG